MTSIERIGVVVASIAVVVGTVGQYDNATALFGPIVPLVVPTIGPGGPFAIAAALLSTVALALAPERPR